MKNNEIIISHPPASEIYKSILDILRREKIKQLSDLKNIEITASRLDFEFIASDRYPWVKEIFQIIEREFKYLLTSCENAPTPKIVSERLYSFAGQHNWTIDDKIFPLRAKYSCLFPKRILYLSHQFIHWDECGDFSPNEYWIPVDFLSLLIALSPVLIENLAYLLPSRINYLDEDGTSSSSRGSTYEYREAKGIISIPGSGHGYNSLYKLMAQVGETELDTQLFETPWLIGARTEDYVELIQKYPDEFLLYSDNLGKFINGSNNPETLAEWIKDVSMSVRQLDVIFKNKKKELMSKGLDVTVGTISTLATLLLPDTMMETKSAIATLFGTKTAYEALQWLHEYKQAKDLLSNEKAWLLWRIKR